MNPKPYTPREGSLPWKVLQFFVANPDERLDADAIAVKFDAPRVNVHTQLGPAVQAALLARVEDLESGELMYSLGASAAAQPSQPASSSSGAGGRRPQRATAPPSPPASSPWPASQAAKRRTRFWIDVGALRIEKNVPLPQTGKSMDWQVAVEKLAVGDSFLLPNEAKGSISKFAQTYKKDSGKKLAIRRVDGGIRVWRTA